MNLYVLISDAYLHCLPPFAYLFNKFWSDTQAVTVVGFQHPPTPMPRNFAFLSLGQQSDYTWSQAVRRFCEAVASDVFCLFLEDYFLSAPVDTSRVYQYHNYMHAHRDIVKIDLTDDRLKVAHEPFDAPLPGLIRSADDALFQTSTQAALWRRDYLERFLEDSETPWEYEKKGSKRVIAARRKGDFSGHVLGTTHPPVQYVNAVGGGQGNTPTWAKKRFPAGLWNELHAKGLM